MRRCAERRALLEELLAESGQERYGPYQPQLRRRRMGTASGPRSAKSSRERMVEGLAQASLTALSQWTDCVADWWKLEIERYTI